MLLCIISGGQTGVDRAALDAALEAGLVCGGWCPKGRLAEDGPISLAYPLEETPSADYPERTEWNVRDSDATLALTFGAPQGGTAFTIEMARKHRRPCLTVDLSTAQALVEETCEWLCDMDVETLNVAGPRASTAPEIYGLAKEFVRALIEGCRAADADEDEPVQPG